MQIPYHALKCDWEVTNATASRVPHQMTKQNETNGSFKNTAAFFNLERLNLK